MWAGVKCFFNVTVFREVPRGSVGFVVSNCGGRVGWQGEGSPFNEDDESITHHVVDRPIEGERVFFPRDPINVRYSR